MSIGSDELSSPEYGGGDTCVECNAWRWDDHQDWCPFTVPHCPSCACEKKTPKPSRSKE